MTPDHDMEGPLKELAKLEKLTAKGKGPSIQDSLDALLLSLQQTKDAIQSGDTSSDHLALLAKTVEGTKKDIDERQKEIYSSMAKFGKAWDKVWLSAEWWN